MALDIGVDLTLDRSEELVKAIRALTRKQVLVGIPSTAAGRTGPVNNASLGYIAEYGSPAQNVPARPWLGPEMERQSRKAVDLLKRAAQFAGSGKLNDATKQLEALGLQTATAVKNNIVSGGDPKFAPNSPVTVARKGSDKPLIDTAQMLTAITYVVRDRAR